MMEINWAGTEAAADSRHAPSFHPDARIHSDCAIGAGTVVWQFASIIRNARIGEDCKVAACAIVDGATVGDRSTLGYGAFVCPGIAIGDEVFIGPYATFCNDPWPRASKDGWFDIHDLIGGRVIVTRVCNGASIGAQAIIMPGVKIGERAMIAAGATVDRDVPPDMLFRSDGLLSDINEARVHRMRACSVMRG